MPKFRTMFLNTPQVATHLLTDEKHVTKIGKFMRKLSLDELPQLICLIKGDMKLIGPRPALYNQYDLIKKRTIHGIHNVKPGITGWAQVNGRDNISIDKKVELDKYFILNKSFRLNCKILYLTLINISLRKNISH